MSKHSQCQYSSLFFIDEGFVFCVVVRSRRTDEPEQSCQFLFTYFFQSTFFSSLNLYSLDLASHRLCLLLYFFFCSFFFIIFSFSNYLFECCYISTTNRTTNDDCCCQEEWVFFLCSIIWVFSLYIKKISRQKFFLACDVLS